MGRLSSWRLLHTHTHTHTCSWFGVVRCVLLLLGSFISVVLFSSSSQRIVYYGSKTANRALHAVEGGRDVLPEILVIVIVTMVSLHYDG